MGVNMVSTANNHCLDRGFTGLFSTLDALDLAGLFHVGTHKKNEDAFSIVEIDGIKCGFLSFTYGTNAFANGIYLKRSEGFAVDLLQNQELSCVAERLLINSKRFFMRALRKIFWILGFFQMRKPVFERRSAHFFKEARVKRQIKKCRKNGAQFVFALLHVGGQYNESPTRYAKRICRKCVLWGADCVIANHEHIVQKTEFYKGKFIAYSLGNFIGENGVTKEPFDKTADFSVAIHADLKKDAGKKIGAKYSFSVYKTCASGKRVYTENVAKAYKMAKEEEKRALLQKNSVIVNKILGTNDISFDIQEEYQR